MMHEHEDELVVDAALALIDDWHERGAATDVSTRRLCSYERRRCELLYLRETISELERVATRLRDCDAKVVSLWEPVAKRQRRERQTAEQENSRLKAALRVQTAAARRMADLLLVNQSITSELLSHNGDVRVNRAALDDAGAVAALQLMLDEQCVRASRLLCGDSTASSVKGLHRTMLSKKESAGGLRMVVEAAKRMPFKVSVVAKAHWESMLGDCQADNGSLPPDTPEEVFRTFNKLLKSSAGSCVMQGTVAMRRVFEPDGSMKVVWASVSQPTRSMIRDHPLHGWRMNECGWIRIARPMNMICQGAYVETTTDLQFTTIGQDGDDRKLDELLWFLTAFTVELGQHGKQKHENLLIDSNRLSRPLSTQLYN